MGKRMSQETELRGSATKNNQGSATKNGRNGRKSAETVDATPDQQNAMQIQLTNAQNALQQGLLNTAQATSDVLAGQSLALIQDLTAFKIATQAATIFEGENNVAEVTTAFLHSISQSGYLPSDAIANLKSSQPLLLQAIAPKQLTQAA